MMDASLLLLAAEGGGFNPMTYDPAAVVLSLISLVGLAFVLRRFAWGPMLAAIEKREERIEHAIRKAEEDRRHAEELLREHQERVKNVEGEVAALREKGRADAEAIRKEILEKADGEAAARADRAVREIELARVQALEEIRAEAVHIGMAVASRVVGRSLDGEDQRRLATEVVDGLGSVGSKGS